MEKKKINPKRFAIRLNKWMKEVETRIAEVMTQQGIKAISLLDNGVNSQSVDTIHTMIADPDTDDIVDVIVGLIYVEGKNLIIIPEDFIYLDMVDKISEKGDVLSQEAWDSLNINIPNEYLVDEIFSPTETLMSMASSVAEIIDIMEEKILTNGEAIKIF